MIEIEAIDLFVESDPTSGEDEGNSLISLRVPADRELARQLKELGAKWDDQAKEWRLYGSEATVKQIGSLCKTAFPKLPRRRNRLVAAQVSASTGKSWTEPGDNQEQQTELVARVEFTVNRTLKNYRRGQNLKWVREFKQIISLPSGSDSEAAQSRFLAQIRPNISELERAATEAFEALLLNRKDAVAAILKEAGIEQV